MTFSALARRFRHRVFLFGCAALLGLAFYGFAQDAPSPIFSLQDERLNELSGMTASRRAPGYYFAHNDSGDTARAFLLSPGGKTVATLHLEGVAARDWEDMTSAGGYLYFGDIGDNFEVMENIKIHRIREPEINLEKSNQEIKIAAAQIETMTLQYPDGAHNAETLAATPDGRILIVSKSDKGSNFYATRTPFQAGAGTLEKIGGPVQLGNVGYFTKLATGGELSPDGKKLAVCTYSQLYEFPLGAPFDLNTLDLKNPKIQSLPTLKQCESAAYSLDGRQVLVSSEYKNAPVYALPSLLGAK